MQTVPDSVATAERRFFAAMAVAAFAVVFAGFAGSYSQRAASLPLVVHVHALLFATWVVLLVAQTGLVAADHVSTHRRLGVVAVGLVPAMLVFGFTTAVQGARDGWNPGGPYRDAISFMFVGVADLVVFGTLAVAGLVWRRRPAVHKRLMLLGTLGGLMWPAITRLPIVAGRPALMFGVLALLMLAPAARDLRTRAGARWMTFGVALAVLVTFPLRVAVANSAQWRAVAMWWLG